MKILKIVGVLFCFCCLICSSFSCERDDICAEDENTTTTPQLIIKFIDSGDGISPKAVNELRISAQGATADIMFTSPVDSILIPLKTDATKTDFIFTINSDTSNDEIVPNEDPISFQYTVEEEYLNSACGFRASYLGLTLTEPEAIDPDANWIEDVIIEVNDVINENNTHVLIFH